MSAELIAPARQEPLGPVAHDAADSRAFDAVYREHFDRLRRFVFGMTGQAALAEDIAQETLMRVYVRRDTFDFNRPLWPWLKTVATRLVFDDSRSHRRESLEADPAEEAAGDAFDVTVERELLKDAMRSLPVRQRVAVTLRYLEDWKAAEVADALGLTRMAAEQLLLRARRRLSTEYLALGGEKAPALRIALWPLLALVGGLRGRVARFRQFMSGGGAAQLPMSVDAVTQMVAAAAVSGVLLTGGVALAAPAPDEHVTAVHATAFHAEEIRAVRGGVVIEKAGVPARKQTVVTPGTQRPAVPAPAAAPPVAPASASTPPPAGDVTRLDVQTAAPVDQAPARSGTQLTKERTAQKYLLKGRVEGSAGDLAPGGVVAVDANCTTSRVVAAGCEALDTVDEPLPAETD